MAEFRPLLWDGTLSSPVKRRFGSTDTLLLDTDGTNGVFTFKISAADVFALNNSGQLTYTQSATTGVGLTVQKTVASADSPLMRVQSSNAAFAQTTLDVVNSGTASALAVARSNSIPTTPIAVFACNNINDTQPVVRASTTNSTALLFDGQLSGSTRFSASAAGVISGQTFTSFNATTSLDIYPAGSNYNLTLGKTGNNTNIYAKIGSYTFQVNDSSTHNGAFRTYSGSALIETASLISLNSTTNGGVSITSGGADITLNGASGYDINLNAANHSSSDINFTAHGATIPLNSVTAGQTTLNGTLPQNIIGAINAAYATGAGVTLDQAYNYFGGPGTVTIDAGDLTWTIQSVYDFVIDDGTNVYFSTDGANNKLYVGSASIRTELGPIDGNIVFTTGVATRGIYAPSTSSVNVELSSATGNGDVFITSLADVKLTGNSITMYDSGFALTFGSITAGNSYFKQTGYFQFLADGIAAWPGTANATGMAVDGGALEYINTASSALLQGVSVKVDGGSGTTILENDKWSMSVGTNGLATITPDSANTQDIVKINNPLATYYGLNITATGTNTQPANQKGIYSQGQCYIYGTTATNLNAGSWIGLLSHFTSTGSGLGSGEEVYGVESSLSTNTNDVGDFYGVYTLMAGTRGSGSYVAFEAAGSWDYALTGTGKVSHQVSNATGWTGSHYLLDTYYTSGGNITSNLYGHRIYIGNNALDSSATYYGLYLSTTSNTAFVKYGIFMDGNWRYGLKSTSGLHVLTRTNGTWQGFGPILTVENLNTSGDAGPSLYVWSSSTSNNALEVAGVGTGLSSNTPTNIFYRSGGSSSSSPVVVADNQDSTSTGGTVAALRVANSYNSASSKCLEIDSAYSSGSNNQETRRGITFLSAKRNTRQVPLSHMCRVGNSTQNNFVIERNGTYDSSQATRWYTTTNDAWLWIPIAAPHNSSLITVRCLIYSSTVFSVAPRVIVYRHPAGSTAANAAYRLGNATGSTAAGAQTISVSCSGTIDNTANDYYALISTGTNTGFFFMYSCDFTYDITDFSAGCGW